MSLDQPSGVSTTRRVAEPPHSAISERYVDAGILLEALTTLRQPHQPIGAPTSTSPDCCQLVITGDWRVC